ncbi:unnamed protein product [Symbiodinium microadriaticum]|nr:unnamed protein product [Symbiodinium microadriaticum]
MAALPGVPLGPAVEPDPAVAEVPEVRNLTRSRQGFSREIVVEAPVERVSGIARFLNVEALRLAQPYIQNLLNNQLRFLIKVVARVRLAETVVDPETELESEFYTDVWVPLGPWPVPPLARVDERFHRYIQREADSRLQFALQESNYTEDSRKRVVGVRTLMLLAGPAALTANIPAAKARGPPFYDEPAPLGPGSMLRDKRKMVDIGLDFSMLPQGRVAFEDIDRFEVCNSGKVGVYVYEPLSVEWSVLGPSTVRPLREPSVDKPYQHEIILLLHRKHYSLIYNFSQTSSLRSQNLPEEMRRGSQNAPAQEFCDASPEQRASAPSIRLPENFQEAKLHYKPGSSAEWAELVISADLEVFHDASVEDEGQGKRALAKQHDVASTCYVAKGRCGYDPPKKHLMNLDRCRIHDGHFDVMERFLCNLLDLARDYLRWCGEVNKPNLVSRKLLSLPLGVRHVAIRLALQRSKFFITDMELVNTWHLSARGGYDFHFLVRAIAYLQQVGPPAASTNDESDVEEFTPEEMEYLADLQFGDDPMEAVEWKRLKFEVLVKSGERYLQVRLGPLVFLDSCNIFPTSLDALIADLRSTEKNPAKAFPLLAERHPHFKGAELHEDEGYRAQVWSMLLKKIPMPFERLTGPECWGMPALMPDKSYYDSRLAGERCSDAKYEEISEIVDFFGFKTFGEFHDAYLHTDMALADVLEAYREAFFEHYGLDPAFYVTGASAAWDAMLKRCVGKGQPLELISDRKIYEITRASVRGGLSNPFQPYARANNPGLGEAYNDMEPTSYIKKFDVNSQYPSVMSRPLPVDGGRLLELAANKKERLK